MVVRRFDRGYLETDPLKFVHRYDDPRDREIVGLIAAAFAYGNVQVIFRSVERILEGMGPRPHAFLADFDPRRDAARFRGFRHRFHGARDLALFLSLVGQAIRAHGSLGRLFAAGYDDAHPHVGPALTHFVETILAGDARPFYRSGRVPPSAAQRASTARRPRAAGARASAPRAAVPLRFLLSSPADGSACKRLLLYLRWMVRPDDGLDTGLWADAIPASKLLIPLDTHTFRIARYLGLTERAASDWKAAVEVTEGLKRFDPADPVRYDFALCRLGILDLCPARRDERKCRPCDLYDVCRL